MKTYLLKSIFAFSLFGISLLTSTMQAQCPRMAGAGDATTFINFMGNPYWHQFRRVQPESMSGFGVGVYLGAIVDKKVHLQTGLEFSWVKRLIKYDTLLFGDHDRIKTRMLEIPAEVRIMLFKSMDRKTHGYFVFGPGFAMSNVIETTNDSFAVSSSLLHQFFIRASFEQSVMVRHAFNFIWGFMAKTDILRPDGASVLNGTHYLGLKLGIQLGL